MAQIASDNFQRADETPLASPWAQVGTTLQCNLVAHLVVPSSGVSANYMAAYTSGSWPNDQYSEVTIVATVNFSGPAARLSTINGGYILLIPAPGAAGTGFFQSINGADTRTNIQSFSITPQVGDVIRLGVVGTTLTVYQNGSSVASTTNVTFASGTPGLVFNGASPASISAWAGGDFTVAPVVSGRGWLNSQNDYTNKKGLR